MATTLSPEADRLLATFAENASAKLTALPAPYGITVAQALNLHNLYTDYATRLGVVGVPETRNSVTLAEKNAAKIALRRVLSDLIRIVSATPAVTPAMRLALGLRVKDVTPTPTPVPATAPQLAVTPDGVCTVHDLAAPSRRAKPAGTQGTVIFTLLLPPTAPPPTTIDEAKFAMLATRNRFALPLPPDADAKKLYVFARWYNPRGELGPASAVAVTTVAA